MPSGPAQYPDHRPIGPEHGWSPWGPPRDPGPIPLRPMGVGDVLSAAVGVTRRHWRSIGMVCAGVSLLASAANLATLAATDSLAAYAATTWVDDLISGRSTLPPTGILLAMLATVLVSAIGSVVAAGVATAYAGADALGRDRTVAADRMRGRWGVLLLVGAAAGALSTAGFAAFVVPGVIVFLLLSLAGPVAVMERAPLPTALRRSVALTEGSRGRIFGAVLVANVLTGIGSALVVTALTPLVLSLFSSTDPVAVLVVGEVLTALIAFVAGTYCAAVIAVLYIEIRVRKEGLAQSLRAAAAQGGSPTITSAPGRAQGAPPTA